MFGIQWPVRRLRDGWGMCPKQRKDFEQKPVMLETIDIVLAIGGNTVEVCKHLHEAAETTFRAHHGGTQQPQHSGFNERFAVLSWAGHDL